MKKTLLLLAVLCHAQYETRANALSWPNHENTGTIINEWACTPPTITSNPSNTAACSGSNATFSVAATDATAYQWQVDTNGDGNFTDLTNGNQYSNVATSTLSITGTTASMAGYRFRARVMNGSPACYTDSNYGTLMVSNIISSGSQTNVSCYNGSDATATVTASGGVGTLTYSWSPSGGTSATAIGLSAGNYVVTITDAIGCSATRSFTISQPSALSVMITSITNVTNPGGSDGSATVSVSGGTGSYSYMWSPYGGTAATADNLSAGNYTVRVTDIKGCTAFLNVTITQPIVTTWNGASWDNGTPNAQTLAVIAGNYSSTGNLVAKTLTVNSGTVTINSGNNLGITGALTLNGGTLTLENNANLLQTDNVDNAGNINVKRDAKMWRQDYVYWGAPVIGQNLRNFSPGTLLERFYVLKESDNSFQRVFTAAPAGLEQPLSYNFIPAKGYLVRAPNTFPNPPAQGATPTTVFHGMFTGVPNNGDVSIATPATVSKFHLIANPYPSTVSGASFLGQNPGTIYFWTHHDQVSGNAIDYATYNLSGGTDAPDYEGAVTPDGSIAIGQGFMFLNQSANIRATFTNSMRTGINNAVFYREANTKSRIWIALSKDNSVLNRALVAYIPETSIGFDPSYDGLQIEGGSAISSMIGADKYAIQARAEFEDTDVVPMHFVADTAGNYTLSLSKTDGVFADSQSVFLKDNTLNTLTDLKTGAYNFTSEAGAFASRFEVVYQASPLANPTFEANKVVIFKENNLFNINSGNSDMAKVQVFDIRGSLIYTKDGINANATTLNGMKAAQGVLMVRITSKEGAVVTRKVVN